MGVKYATREEVMSSPDIKSTGTAVTRVDSVIESSSRDIDRLLHYSTIAPLVATKRWDYPNEQRARSGRLWLNDWPLWSATTFISGGVTVPPSGYVLEPNRSGPPYSSININRLSSYALSMGNTSGQQALSITGLWALENSEEGAGTLTSSIVDASTVSINVSTPLGVGSLIRIDSERMIVTTKTYVTSGQTGTLVASNAATALTVANGAVFSQGEELLIDTERVQVEEILGNTLMIRRATGGSVLAAHTAATVYWPRTYVVQRGAQGTTPAAHSNGAAISRWVPPGPINELCIAYSLDRFFQRGSGYARTIGSGENERQATGGAIRQMEERVRMTYGRVARISAV